MKINLDKTFKKEIGKNRKQVFCKRKVYCIFFDHLFFTPVEKCSKSWGKIFELLYM